MVTGQINIIKTASVSVVCGVRDRLPHLLQAIPTWLACPEVGEVVVVDWSSAPPVDMCVAYDERLVFARVEGQEHWVASKCFNLGLRLATGDRVLRLDADDLLDGDFFAAHRLGGENFYCFDDDFYFNDLPDDNARHLMGVVYAAREHFLRVNGYNERIATYGYDDEDLVRRLLGSGLVAHPLDLSTLHHIPHGDDLRTANQVVPADLHERPPWAPWNWRPGKVVDNLADRNRHVAEDRPWGKTDSQAAWKVELVVPGYYLCQEVKDGD